MCQESLSPTFSRRPSLWALSVLAVSFGMTACLDLVTDQAMAKLTGDSPDRSAPLTPEQVLERMAATLQEMDTLSVQVDGFWAAALQGGDTSGVLQLARPGKVSWIEEGNSFGPSVESVVSDGTPEGLLRWEYIPRDNTYRMRTDTPEDWGLPPEEALTRHLPLAGVLFHGGRLEGWGLLGMMRALEDQMPEENMIHPLTLSLFSTAEALPAMEELDELPRCDCHGVEGWLAVQFAGGEKGGMAHRLRLWIDQESNLPRRLEFVGYRLLPGPWDPQDPFAFVMEWDGEPMAVSINTENYSNYVVDEPIPDDTFQPHFPEGATLIEAEPPPPEPEES